MQVSCDTPQQAIDAVAHEMHLSIVSSKCMDQSHTMVLRMHIDSGHSVADVIRELERFKIIAVAQPNYTYQAPPEAQRADQAVQTEANNAIQYALAKLDLTAVHQVATGAGIKIAVINSQIDVKNPELAGDIAGEFDAVGEAEPPDVHGTEMAGVIAAHDRLTGIAPRRADLRDPRLFAFRRWFRQFDLLHRQCSQLGDQPGRPCNQYEFHGAARSIHRSRAPDCP